MRIPEGYVLVRIADMPKMISESVRTVLTQKQISLSEKLLAELGKNAAGTLALNDASEEF